MNKQSKEKKRYKECEYVDKLDERLKAHGCSPFVCQYIVWYIKHAQMSKILFYVLSISAIAAPLISSVLTIVLQSIFISILSAVSSFCVSLLSLTQCQKRWLLYRSTSEKLKMISEMYLARGDFSSNAYETFVKDICDILREENISWQEKLNDSNNSKIPNPNTSTENT